MSAGNPADANKLDADEYFVLEIAFRRVMQMTKQNNERARTRVAESYGQSGMAAFREEAARGGVCVAREEALRAAPGPREVEAALRRLNGGPRVAVCWCEGRTARALLDSMAREPYLRLNLIASDGWADRRDVVDGLEPHARGALTLRIRSPYLHDFDDYYRTLSPHTNTRNPWFRVRSLPNSTS